MPEKVLTADQYYEFISKRVLSKPAWQMRINAHVRAKTKHSNILLYHHNGASEEEKAVLYKEIIAALIKDDPNMLLGDIAQGQAVAPVDPPMDKAPEPAPEPEAQQQPQPRFTIPVTETDEPDPITWTKGPDPIVKLREALEAIGIKGQSQDPKLVEKLVTDRLAAMQAAIDKRLDEINKDAQSAIAMAIKNLPPRAAIEIREGNKVRELKGVFHRQLTQAIAWVNADVPLWFWGEAGGGKTTMANQIAEALGIKPYVIAMHEDITVGKLMGYRNLANGEYVPGLLYEPYKNGGLGALDEIDVSAPAIACANSLIANKTFMFPNGETVERHPLFRVVAFANTKGTGAVAGYTARNRLDAATLDRFAIVKLEYDEGLERCLVCGGNNPSEPWKCGGPASDELVKRWVDWVQACRRVAGGSVLISPRVTENGVKALKYGIPTEDVAEALMFKLVTPDTKARLLREAGAVPHE